MKKPVRITVEVTEWNVPRIIEVDIERPIQKNGTVCFDGRWVTPERRADGKYYLKIVMPAPNTAKQQAINTRCVEQLLAMSTAGCISMVRTVVVVLLLLMAAGCSSSRGYSSTGEPVPMFQVFR